MMHRTSVVGTQVVGTPAIASLPLAFAYLNWTFGMLAARIRAIRFWTEG